MFKETPTEYLYFNFKGSYFRIPTYGKITKIIDFGRATFKIQNKIFFSDVFKKNGVQIKEMSADEFNAWREIAKETSYKKFVSGYKDGQRLLDLALSVD